MVRDPAATIHPFEYLKDDRMHKLRHPLIGDVFSVDFRHRDPSTLLAGGRRGGIWLGDLRQNGRQAWVNVAAADEPVAHVKSVGEHCVLMAGTHNKMALYDLRFNSKIPNAMKPVVEETRPLFHFRGYKNEAHVTSLGLDVDPVQGLVAAAQDDGTVALFSLHSGRRLPSRDIDAIKQAGPVAAIHFATMPCDQDASLFVGKGGEVHKFSFGKREGEDEDVS